MSISGYSGNCRQCPIHLGKIKELQSQIDNLTEKLNGRNMTEKAKM